MMKRMMWVTPMIVAGVVLGSVAPASASGQARLPGYPGCTVQSFTADHTTGDVSWTIACEEDRDVVVDATAFRGTADDHEIVDERTTHEKVSGGTTWSGSAHFDPAGIDQIRAQAVTFVNISDPTEPPAIIGGARG